MVFSKYLLLIKKNTLLRGKEVHSTIKSMNDYALALGMDVFIPRPQAVAYNGHI